MSMADKQKAKLFSKLRTQGGAFKTKGLGGKPAESGTGTGTGPDVQVEEGSEASGNRAPKQKTRDGEGSGDVDLGVTVASLAHVRKKARIESAGAESVLAASDAVGVNAPDLSAVGGTGVRGSAPERVPDNAEGGVVRAGGPVGEKAPGTVVMPGTSAPRAPARKEIMIGKKTLGELAGMAASIADERELKKMEGHSLLDIYRGRLALWAQEGMLLAADRPTITRGKEQMQQMSAEISEKDKQLAEAREEVKEKDKLLAEAQEALREEKLQVLLRAQVNEQLQGVNRKLQEANEKLQDQLDELYAQEHILNEKLKHAGERESDLKDRVVELETELDGRRPEHVVIQEYKASDEYLDDLMSAAVKDLQKCWAVTKDLTKADPDHSYAAFCDAFEAAAIEPEVQADPEAQADAAESAPPRDPVNNEAPAGQS